MVFSFEVVYFFSLFCLFRSFKFVSVLISGTLCKLQIVCITLFEVVQVKSYYFTDALNRPCMVFFTSMDSKVFFGPSSHRNLKKLLRPRLLYGSINKRIIAFLSLLSLSSVFKLFFSIPYVCVFII